MENLLMLLAMFSDFPGWQFCTCPPVVPTESPPPQQSPVCTAAPQLSPIMYSMEHSQHPLSPRLSVAELSKPEPFNQFCLSVLVMPSSQPVVCPPSDLLLKGLPSLCWV